MLHYKSGNESFITGVKKPSEYGFGVYYRYRDAFAINAFAEIKKIMFGISYDINTSTLLKTSKGRGGLEVFIKIKNSNYLYKRFGKW